MPRELFRGVDNLNRSWLVTTRPGLDGSQLVTFICWKSSGCRKALDQMAVWHPVTGWDKTHWLPEALPVLVLARVVAALQEVAA